MTLQDLRLKKKLTQKEVAEKLNVTKEYVSDLERSVRKPSDRIKMLLSEIYKVNIGTIFLAMNETESLKKGAKDGRMD